MPKKEQRKRFSRPASSSPRRPQRQSERRVREQDPNTIPSYLVNHLAQALRMVLKLDGPADVLLSVYFKRNHELGSRDRGFVAEAVYAALRHLAGIRWRMAPAVPERSPRLAALVTLASLYGMEALDSRDVGNDRKALEAILDKKDSDADPATRAELPGWLYERVRSQYPDHDLFFKEIATGAPLDIRVNLLKGKRDEVLEQLKDEGKKVVATPISPDGIRFLDKPGITHWPLYQDGVIDVQDEGSQLIARLVAPKRREMVCDFCAGAGGKTLAIGALMRSGGSLYAFDVNEKRLQGMVPRLRRSGLTNVHPIAIRDEHDKRLGRLLRKFDRVLIDAPCTGTGTVISGNEKSLRGLTEQLLVKCARSQRALLDRAMGALKPGGTLVYSTCSILPQENEDALQEALDKHMDCELIPLDGTPSESEARRAQGAGEDPHIECNALTEAIAEGHVSAIANGMPGTLNTNRSISCSRSAPPTFSFTFSPFNGSTFSVLLRVISTGQLSDSCAGPLALTIP